MIFLNGHIRNMFNKIRFSDYKFFEIPVEFSSKRIKRSREKCYIFSSNKEEKIQWCVFHTLYDFVFKNILKYGTPQTFVHIRVYSEGISNQVVKDKNAL